MSVHSWSSKIRAVLYAAAGLCLLCVSHPALADAASFKKNLQTTAQGTGHLQRNSTAGGDEVLLTTLGRFIQALLALSGVIFLFLTIYAGFRWMTAAGNDSDVSKAKDTLRNALIGLVVVMAAYAITFFVSGQLLYFTSYNPPIPEYGH